MLVLTSNGISSNELLGKLKGKLNANDNKAAIITTASKQRKNLPENLKRHTEIFNTMGLEVSPFDIEAPNQPEQLYNFDLIFIMGGNPFYLLKALRDQNCKKIFKRLIKEKIVIGASAGSIVLGKDSGYIFAVEPNLNEEVKLKNFAGLGLTDIHVYPHANNDYLFNDKIYSTLENYKTENNLNIQYLKDGEGIFIE